MDYCEQLNLVVRQVCVPDYRAGLFEALSKQLKSIMVFAGTEYFDKSIQSVQPSPPWLSPTSNRFLAHRRFVWLGPLVLKQPRPLVVIHEWNPRILSFWRDWAGCRRRNIPMIVWGHAWGKDGPRGIMFRLRHWIGRRADGIICYTESQAVLTRKMVGDVPVVAAPNACLRRGDCGVSGDEAMREAVICVGRLVRAKKVELLITAFAEACRAGSKFGAKLVIVGDGPERFSLAKRATELGIADRVSWLGHQSAIQVLRAAYSGAFVSVSAGYVGLSLTQSFAFGVPALIANDEPHSPEIEAAREGVNARFFASDDPADLAAKLNAAWVEWRGIEEKRRELSAWTAENYSFEKMAERFCAMAELVTREVILSPERGQMI